MDINIALKFKVNIMAAENGDAWIANFSLNTINSQFPTLPEVATILQDGMESVFRELTVDIATCPCLTEEPFNLAGIGLNGNPSIIQVGDYTNLIPNPLYDSAKWNIEDMLLSTGYDSFIIGSGYAAYPYLPYNGHLIMNAAYKAPNITNASRIVFADKGQRRIVMLTQPKTTTCSFMGNFFLSEGRESNVLKVRAKGRQTDLDIITIMQDILYRHYRDCPVALGGVLRMRNGRVALNVMPKCYFQNKSSFRSLSKWFDCHDIELEQDLIAVGTIINTEPDILHYEQRYNSPLPRRHHQFHSFSNYGAGGQFVNDITRDTIEYEGYFNLANKIYMSD
ncbi:ester hydrolase C11orf54 homolog [Temnothorax longispinosus]|uniref:ester hydrolase C11orf54 homolog n=1 Tax=Temnothorax longispinosus TaxID=300112 RepID=UPI003A9A2A31